MTAHTADLAALHAHLDAHPDDWTARLVLADLLTDLGDDKGAACQRWMVIHERAASHVSLWGVWMWEASFQGSANLSMLPLAAQRRASGLYHTRQSAEAALLAGLVAAGEI